MKAPIKRKKKPIKKVYSLALGTGYAEDASWSNMIIVHRRGFNCIQDALVNLNELVIRLCADEIVQSCEHKEMMNRWAADAGNPPKYPVVDVPRPEELVEETVREIIHGTFQDHGDFWELLGDEWASGSLWTSASVARHGMCFIDRAPELIAAAPSWGDTKVIQDGDLWRVETYMYNRPKGVKCFRSQVRL